MNHYNKDRDNAALGKFYTDHVSAMTREGLHAKSDIASELAVRDAEIAQLRADAERYRFLRSCNIDMRNRLEHYADSALDTAIDAARGGE